MEDLDSIGTVITVVVTIVIIVIALVTLGLILRRLYQRSSKVKIFIINYFFMSLNLLKIW